VNPGERAVQFVQRLRHQKGQWGGSNIVLETWQRSYVETLVGTLREDGLRQYRTSLLFLPRKNGKTTLAAALVVHFLLCENEAGGEIYSAAADREQASICYRAVVGMIRADPYLSRLAKNGTIKIRESKKLITYVPTGTEYRAISSDAATKHGYSASVIIADELHAWPGQRGRDLWDVLTTSTGARRQPLTIAITTAGHEKNSVCYELYDYAKKVRDGVIDDPSFLPVIYEAPEASRWDDPETWKAANPNYGVSVSTDYFERAVAKARDLPTYENTFRQLHLNEWTESSCRWLPSEKWDACYQDTPITDKELRDAPCWAGLDLSSTTDLTALVLVFRLANGWAAKSYFYAPREGARRRQDRDRVPYQTWASQGHLTLTDGDVVDYERVRADILRLVAHYKVREVALDRWNATQLTTQLQGDGVTVVPYGQGFASYSGPSREFEGLVLGGKLKFDNPVLKWNGDNVVAEIDAAGNIKPSKAKSTERIDGVCALLMALGRAIAGGKGDEGPSDYSGRGIVSL
jgi:phage terminase large subunit-like protein